MSDEQRPADRGPENESAPRMPDSARESDDQSAEADPGTGWHDAEGTPYEGDCGPDTVDPDPARPGRRPSDRAGG
ncbi:hypothetical protein ACFVHB_06485 [Kitasatospora sp. NPDC127111]|uniref:hypothetical protein n=1 Tax=Kitasatospora sp. NPDC127111 TaxID=3345363 RepID=UPI003625567E